MAPLMFAAAVVAVVSMTALAQDKPMDLPCVTWEPLQYGQPTNPDHLFLAAYTWVEQDINTGQCITLGDIFPCFSSDPGSNTWGHHDYENPDITTDYCRSYVNGSVYESTNMYVPRKGPKWQTWKWHLAQSGGQVPANAIRFGDKVMARSTQNAPGECCGTGFTGWAEGKEDGTFGNVHFSIVNNPVTTQTFEVAICEAYHPTTTPTPSTPAPTLPPNTKPYIRFGHAIPAPNHVDAVITQGNISFTWTDYQFAQFSPWVEKFIVGDGYVHIYENINGTRGPLLVKDKLLLTPGPLVVVVKDYWPPVHGNNVEMIAASYVPPFGTTGCRLFNLSPDTASAGMQVNGVTVVDGVKYSLGSTWAPLPHKEANFTAFDDTTKALLAQVKTSPPSPPYVFTNFLLGLQNASVGSTYVTRFVPLIDAPEW